jgi:hypothetical protein
MSKFVGTRPSSYEKRIYWAAVSQRLRTTAVDFKRSIFYVTYQVFSEKSSLTSSST